MWCMNSFKSPKIQTKLAKIQFFPPIKPSALYKIKNTCTKTGKYQNKNAAARFSPPECSMQFKRNIFWIMLGEQKQAKLHNEISLCVLTVVSMSTQMTLFVNKALSIQYRIELCALTLELVQDMCKFETLDRFAYAGTYIGSLMHFLFRNLWICSAFSRILKRNVDK